MFCWIDLRLYTAGYVPITAIFRGPENSSPLLVSQVKDNIHHTQKVQIGNSIVLIEQIFLLLTSRF
jgi:hypothetical protein